MGVKLCENTVVELKVLRISDVGDSPGSAGGYGAGLFIS